MDQLRFVETAYRIQHKHRDGTWAQFEEDPAPQAHGSPEHDPERSWLRGRIFRCRSCDEAVTIVPGGEGGIPDRMGTDRGSAAETARHVVEVG